MPFLLVKVSLKHSLSIRFQTETNQITTKMNASAQAFENMDKQLDEI